MQPARSPRETPEPAPLPQSHAEAGAAPRDDEPVLLVEPLDLGPASRHRGVELRPLLNVASIALLVVLLLVGGVVLVRLRSPAGSPNTVTSAVHIFIGPSGANGWNPAGTAAAQDIVFAPGSPTTAYDCGAPGLSQISFNPVPIAVATSRDGGHTWHALPSPGGGVTCGLTVNPTDPFDVVLMVSPSSTFVSAPMTLYRTFDGGRTWTRLTLPPRLGPQTGAAEYATWAWSGSTLYLAPYFPNTTGYTDLAASIAGNPFVWVQQNGLFNGAPADASINQLLGTPTTLYVVLFSQTTCTQVCIRMLASPDAGATWTPYVPTFQGRPITPLSQSADGHTLFGSYFDNPAEAAREYVYSPDGGATWRQLTPLPPQAVASDMFSTPDGTDYAVLDTDPAALSGAIEPQPGVYRLAPGAPAWTFVAPPIDDGSGPVRVSWDTAGHPLSLWSNIHANIADGTQPGLQRHPA